MEDRDDDPSSVNEAMMRKGVVSINATTRQRLHRYLDCPDTFKERLRLVRTELVF